MRQAFFLPVFACAALVAQAPPSSAEAQASAEVKVGTGIEKMELQGEAPSFKVAAGTKIFAWTKVTGAADSTITWTPVPRATSYQVLWRDTTSPTWDHRSPATQETHATLNLSKDNVIFAVESTDAAGHRSLAVVPQPEH